MANTEREDSYYHPDGIPITPQARRFGYDFPVYVSKGVWAAFCIASDIPSKHDTDLEKRIWHLLQYCYDGMTKKLATSDDFVSYQFKIWYWSRKKPNAKKMSRARLGARLMLDPSTDTPWLYIFDPLVDYIDLLEKGEAPEVEPWDTQDEHGDET